MDHHVTGKRSTLKGALKFEQIIKNILFFFLEAFAIV